MATAAKKNEIQLNPTNMNHIFLCDIRDDGTVHQILVLKKTAQGSIYYVEIDPLHDIDKRRIRQIITSQHANKYEAWELFSQARLGNGMNALEFFHNNFVKVKHPKGVNAASQGLDSISDYTGGEADLIGRQDVSIE